MCVYVCVWPYIEGTVTFSFSSNIATGVRLLAWGSGSVCMGDGVRGSVLISSPTWIKLIRIYNVCTDQNCMAL